MNFKEFSELIAVKEKPVILLEGKRKVLDTDQEKLIDISTLLADSLPNVLFRSGNADGADYLFAVGVCKIDPKRFSVVIPKKTHKKHHLVEGNKIFSLSDVNIFEKLLESSDNRDFRRLANFYIASKDKKGSINATRGAYLLRDALKVIGSDEMNMPPADFAIMYDDLSNPETGGTGFTISVCKKAGIPVINQKTYFLWL